MAVPKRQTDDDRFIFHATVPRASSIVNHVQHAKQRPRRRPNFKMAAPLHISGKRTAPPTVAGDGRRGRCPRGPEDIRRCQNCTLDVRRRDHAMRTVGTTKTTDPLPSLSRCCRRLHRRKNIGQRRKPRHHSKTTPTPLAGRVISQGTNKLPPY